jgi:hypothetical protein
MIRYILLFWVICTCLSPGYAQTDFAPPGAHWYNEGYEDYYHSYRDGDTIIAGKDCYKIMRDIVSADEGWATHYPPLFLYNTADTIFVFNTRFNKFTPLYIYNVHEGDTVTIPELTNWSAADTSFAFVVDSIRIVQYDTAWLRTVFVTPVEPTVWGIHAYSTYRGRYIERIGGLERGIYPDCHGCPTVTANVSRINKLRCYGDPTTTLKFIPGECDPPVSVRDNGKEITSNAWPNPASEVLYIDAAVQSTIILLSSDGREVLRKVTETTYESVDVSQLRSGVYLLLTIDATGTRSRKINVHR